MSSPPSHPRREEAERTKRIDSTCRCSHDYGLETQCRLPAGHLADHLPFGQPLDLTVAAAFEEEARLRFERGRLAGPMPTARVRYQTLTIKQIIRTLNSLDQGLNARAAEGWELVTTIHPIGEYDERQYVFRRTE